MLPTLLAAVLAVAPTATARTTSDVTEAKRLYTIGERQLAEGRASVAVALWRKAILAVPTTRDYDELRHDLVMRLGYGLLAASQEKNDRRYLVEAERMLTRYAERHTALHGDSERAKAERAEIYEQLYEVESRLAPMPATDTAAADTPAPEETDPLPAIENHDDVEGYRRKVRVKTRIGKTSIDDPKIRAEMAGRKLDPETGLWLTRPTLQPLTPARAYVRISGPARSSAGKRVRVRQQRNHQKLAQAVLKSVQPALRACFADAFTRNPTDVVQTRVSLTIGRDGHVRDAKVVGPAVVDTRGNACVTRRLSAGRVPDAPGRSQRLLVPMVFFWENENHIDEGGNGVPIRDELDMFKRKREANDGGSGPMPPIDAPADLR